MQKWKQTVTFTSRLWMPTAPTLERLAPKFPLVQSGATFGKQYSAGRRRSFHLALKPRTGSKLASRMSSQLRAKRFTILHTRPPIILTADGHRKITRYGKFIR